MYTNQATFTDDARVPEFRCQHAPGEATEATCHCLRVLVVLRDAAERARAEHLTGHHMRREQFGSFWRLLGELSYALDHCPDSGAPQPTAPDYASARVVP